MVVVSRDASSHRRRRPRRPKQPPAQSRRQSPRNSRRWGRKKRGLHTNCVGELIEKKISPKSQRSLNFASLFSLSLSLSFVPECNNGADTFGARRIWRVSFFSEDAEVVVVVVVVVCVFNNTLNHHRLPSRHNRTHHRIEVKGRRRTKKNTKRTTKNGWN